MPPRPKSKRTNKNTDLLVPPNLPAKKKQRQGVTLITESQELTPAPPKGSGDAFVPHLDSATSETGANPAPANVTVLKKKKGGQKEKSNVLPAPANTQSTTPAGTTSGVTVQDVQAPIVTVLVQPKKHSSCTKKPSAIGQKALEQELAKQQKREQKRQRVLEKAQNAMVDEAPEETEAFLQANKALQPPPSNIQVGSVPAGPPELVLHKQHCADMSIAQRAVQRFISLAPTMASVSSVNSLKTTQLRQTQRSVPVPPSLQLQSASLQVPSTRTSSPEASRGDFSVGNDADIDFTLAECLKNIPQHLAPKLPSLTPLPEPLREPRRKNQTPHVDLSGLSLQERKNYLKANKFALKNLDESDQPIVSTIISRLGALVDTHDPFPNNTNLFCMAEVANAWGCKKYARANFALIKGSPYHDMLDARLSSMQSGLVKNADLEVPKQYRLKSETTPEVLQKNRRRVESLLHEAKFTLPPQKEGDNQYAFYEHPIFEEIIRKLYFQLTSGQGVVHHKLWKCLTIPALAGVATAVEKVLTKYKLGRQISSHFMAKEFQKTYLSHVWTLCDMYAANGPYLEAYCYRVAENLLRLYKHVKDTPIVIAPRIPTLIISARYAQLQAPGNVSTTLSTTPQASTHHGPPLSPALILQSPDDSLSKTNLTQGWVKSITHTGPNVIDSEAPDVGDPEAWEDAMAPQQTSRQFDALKALVESELETEDKNKVTSKKTTGNKTRMPAEGMVSTIQAEGDDDESDESTEEEDEDKVMAAKECQEESSDSSDDSDSDDEEPPKPKAGGKAS